MPQKPRSRRASAKEASSPHRTVIAAAVRQASAPHPAAPPGPLRLPQRPPRRRDRQELPDPPLPPAGHPLDGWPLPEGAWDDDGAGIRAGVETGGWDGDPAETVVIFDREHGPFPDLGADGGPLGATRTRPPQRTLRRVADAAARAGRAVIRHTPLIQRPTVIPATSSGRLVIPASPRAPQRLSRQARPFALVAASVALLLALSAAGLANRDAITQLSFGIWSTRSGAHVLPTPIGGFWAPPIPSDAPPAPSYTNAAHYVTKYGFDWPNTQGAGLWAGEEPRLSAMMPFALAATARWDARFGDTLEPQMLLFWTHAEGISGRVSYSNCANENTPPGTSYFSYIANCDTPSFWQLGYGNQFGVISILKTAFLDMRGDPNDAHLVQQVGQAVLDWDRRQGTVPACGGYSCTFPALTIDQIMAGVSLDHVTADDWWASVLSRDPAINCYMLARALVWFSHDATRTWVGCYYAEPCWQGESNSLGDILVSWNALLKAANG